MTNLAELPLQLPGGAQRTFFFRPDSVGDQGVIRQIFQSADYAIVPDERFQTLVRYISAQSTSGKRPLIIDAGANIGASTVYFALQYPSSRIVAIEPEKRNAELLRRNCEGLDVLVREAAVGPEAGTAFLTDPGHGDWGFRVGAAGVTPVSMMTVPGILDDPGMSEFFGLICKIDIEGGEEALFSRNTGWIDRFPLVIIELHDWLFPGQANSRNFLRAVCDRDFDFTYRGENAFCFNNRLLERLST